MDEPQIKSFDEELVSVETVTDESDRVKRKLLGKLEAIVDEMDFSPAAMSKRSEIEGRMMVIKGMLEVAESRESTALKRAAIKARGKEIDSNEKFSSTALELLRAVPIRGSDQSLVPPIDPNSPDVPVLELDEKERSSITESSMRDSNTDLTD